MQIFLRNPRQWRRELLSEAEVRLFRKKVKAAKLAPVVIHIPYTLNLASIKRSFYKITVREFITDLKEADRLGATYLVTHPGSYKGGTEVAGLPRTANALKKILKETEEVATTILLENTAGSGHWLGYSFEQLRYLLEELQWSRRVGICLDTAHAWAAGYKIDSPQGVKTLVSEIDRQVGINRLGVIHLNDTQEALGSHRDRHFAIGRGKIGAKGFEGVINHPSLRKVTFILETPKTSDEDDIANLKTVRSLYRDDVHKSN